MKKITKILSLGILFLFVCTLHLSAQKCKFDYNKKDPITGEATKGNTFTISTGGGGFTAAPPVKMGFNKAGDTYSAGMFIRYYGNMRDIIQKGDPLVFKLSNGDVVTLTALEEYLPTAYASQVVVSVYQAQYSIDVPTLQKIAENPPIFLRINIGNMRYEKEISSNVGKQISQAAACILQ